MRILLSILTLLLFALPTAAGDVVVVPPIGGGSGSGSGGGDTLVETRVTPDFVLSDLNLTSDSCTRWVQITTSNDVACTAYSANYYLDDAWTFTRFTFTLLQDHSIETNYACDVDVEIGGVSAGTFLVGGPDLINTGDAVTIPVPAVGSAVAGDIIQVHHDEPATEHCAAGSACSCAGTETSWRVSIYGYLQ